MEQQNVLLIGGSGFLGSHVAHLLSRRGFRTTIATRRRERCKQLILLPTTDVVEADVHDPVQLAALADGQDAVINLIGILHSRSGTPYGPEFAAAHVELPRRIVAACRKARVRRLVHVSALQAARDAPSEYLRSKADGEAAIQESGRHDAEGGAIAWTVFQPSVIFGPGDSFLNLFAGLLRRFPLLPLGCAEAQFQPVYVEDVAACIVQSLTAPESAGRTYELCGPNVYTLRELVAYVGEVIGRPRPIVGLPDWLAYLQAAALEFAPGRLMSRDNVRSMQVDNVCSGDCPLPFDREPTPLEAVVAEYLAAKLPRTRFVGFRTRARR
jgi:NADH dehydrogenase